MKLGVVMVFRKMQDQIMELAKGFPVITITGPRQSGKTTLAKMTFAKYKYIDLEVPQNRVIIKEDPYSLLSDPNGYYIIDEFHYVPELLSIVKVMVDTSRLTAQFILTGSNNFVMMKGVSQSLAGRTAIFELLPFDLSEAYSDRTSLDRVLFRGLYPRLIDKDIDPVMFYGSYINTYLQRDLRALLAIQNLDSFGRFLTLCAGRTGSLLNKQALAADAGVDAKTAANWLSILQSSYIIHLLNPYYGNIGKRLSKSPKLYFLDTGLACNLLGIRDETDLSSHPLRGNIFETLVVSEVIKFYHNRGLKPPVTFYRDNSGLEVDLLVQKGDRFLMMEIKSSQSINPSFYASLSRLSKLKISPIPWLVYGGDRTWNNEYASNVSFWDLREKLDLYENYANAFSDTLPSL